MLPQQNDERLQREWEKEERRDHYRVAAGVMEFLGVVLGVVSILVLAALLMSLLTGLAQDVNSTFAILRTRFQ